MFVDNDAMCLVMEYCTGGDLRQYMDKRSRELNGWTSLPTTQIVEWATMICSALAYVHSKGKKDKWFNY